MVEAHKEQLEEEKTQAQAQDKEFTANVQRLSEAYGDKSQRKLAPASTKPKGTQTIQSTSGPVSCSSGSTTSVVLIDS